MRSLGVAVLALSLLACADQPAGQCTPQDHRPAIDGCNQCTCGMGGYWSITAEGCSLQLDPESGVACYTARAIDVDPGLPGPQVDCLVQEDAPGEPTRIVAMCASDPGAWELPDGEVRCWFPRAAEDTACVQRASDTGIPSVELVFLESHPPVDGTTFDAWCQAYLPDGSGDCAADDWKGDGV